VNPVGRSRGGAGAVGAGGRAFDTGRGIRIALSVTRPKMFCGPSGCRLLGPSSPVIHGSRGRAGEEGPQATSRRRQAPHTAQQSDYHRRKFAPLLLEGHAHGMLGELGPPESRRHRISSLREEARIG
jgi:hypothetical protein